MAAAPNGDLYVALMTSGGRGQPQTGGGAVALRDANKDGKFEVVERFVARLRRLSKSYEEASMDLGADTWVTFRRILLPGIRSALLSGGLLAFALSFDEVIVTSFTAGAGVQTVPLWVLANFSRPNAIPVVNVVALALVIVSIVPVYLAQRFGGDAVAVTR